MTNSTAIQCKGVLSDIMDRARFKGATKLNGGAFSP